MLITIVNGNSLSQNTGFDEYIHNMALELPFTKAVFGCSFLSLGVELYQNDF